jgi:hypothetical protein
MSNPMVPPEAVTPIPPPVLQLPWGVVGPGGMVTLTPNAFEFLTRLWAALQGSGGTFELIIEALDATTRGQLAALAGDLDSLKAAIFRSQLAPPAANDFGVSFTCADISTKALGAVIARVPISIPWTIPVTLFRSTGKVGTAPIADTAFDLQIDTVSIGTATWLAGQTTPTFTKATATVAVNGDYLDLVTPANLNGMAGAFGLTIMGTKHLPI